MRKWTSMDHLTGVNYPHADAIIQEYNTKKQIWIFTRWLGMHEFSLYVSLS